MRKIVFILLLIPLQLFAVKYYVDPVSGNNGDDGLTEGNAWATIAYAVTQATSSGDTIYIMPGTHTVSTNCELAVGVSLLGQDSTNSIISSTLNSEYVSTIELSSGSEGTNGNQTISYLKFDGNGTSWCAIEVNARSNVKVHNCSLVDFNWYGIIFNGKTGYSETSPTTWATGNEIHDCKIYNCAGYYDGWARGALGVGGQQELLIYNDSLIQPNRGTGDNGFLIKYYSNGFNKGNKIYNNYIDKPPFDGTWDFAIEVCMWEQGGLEIYDNTIIGSIDLGARRKGDYDYSVYIHNNIIGKKTRENVREAGIVFENVTEDAIVRYNYFRNLSHGIGLSYGSVGDHIDRVYIQYNIFDQMGNASECWVIYSYPAEGDATSSNVYFDNNVCIAYSEHGGLGIGIALTPSEDADHWYIRNNIFQDFDYAWITAYQEGSGTMNYLYLQNNCLYNNGNSNDPLWESGYNPTHVTNENGIEDNPDFDNYVAPLDTFDLQVTSPCIDAGLGVGLTYDYRDSLVGEIPDIGAIEKNPEDYDPPPTAPIVTTSTPTVVYTRLARGGGNCTDDGGGTVTVGLCWSTSVNPTVSDAHTVSGTGEGAFGDFISNLAAGTTYYIRAYADNGYVTYGDNVTIQMPIHSIGKTGGKYLKYNGKIGILH